MCMRFPLIEKTDKVCNNGGVRLFPLKQPTTKLPARRVLAKEDVLVAQRIKQLRRSRGFTQEELSDLLGMNTSYITQVEAEVEPLLWSPYMLGLTHTLFIRNRTHIL